MRRSMMIACPLLLFAATLTYWLNSARTIRVVSAASTVVTSYPLSRDQAQALLESLDPKDLRIHGWAILKAMTDPSPAVHLSSDELYPPAWEQSSGWKNKCDLGLLSDQQCQQLATITPVPSQAATGLTPNPCATPSAALQAKKLLLEPPVQLQGSQSSSRTLATVLYNKEAADFIADKQLQTLDGLSRLASDASAGAGSDFDQCAVIVKLIWGALVTLSPGKQGIRVFDSGNLGSDTTSTLGSVMPPSRFWKTMPNVDPAGGPCADTNAATDTVSIQCFHQFPYPVTCDQIRALLSSPFRIGCTGSETTKTLVLLGMHIITAEQRDWVWSTFYWTLHPDKDLNHDPTPEIAGRHPWDHYAMMITMRGSDGLSAPPATYNPYLEGPKPNSVTSNCVYCHSMARTSESVSTSSISKLGMPAACSYPGALTPCAAPTYTPSTPALQAMTSTHMLWSLADAQDVTLRNIGEAMAMRAMHHRAPSKKPRKTK